MTDGEQFKDEFESALKRDEPSVIVAKVDAVGPTSFAMDIGLLENRFEFERYIKELGA